MPARHPSNDGSVAQVWQIQPVPDLPFKRASSRRTSSQVDQKQFEHSRFAQRATEKS
jgi:hypothetical protein